jgi:hypothetical protein
VNPQDIDVEFILQLLSGKLFLDLYHFLMGKIIYCGMLIMIKIHLSQILNHLEDGLKLTQNNLMEILAFVICRLIRIIFLIFKFDI